MTRQTGSASCELEPRSRRMARLVLAVALAACSLSCAEKKSAGSAARDGAEGTHVPDDALPAPLRPARLLIFERTAAGCAVAVLEGESKEELAREPCPRDLELGERMRLAGAICMRDSPVEARKVPVRCPGALLDARRRELSPR